MLIFFFLRPHLYWSARPAMATVPQTGGLAKDPGHVGKAGSVAPVTFWLGAGYAVKWLLITSAASLVRSPESTVVTRRPGKCASY